MALISIILGLFLDRRWNTLAQWRQFGWFSKLSHSVLEKTEPHLHNPTARYLALLAIPILATLFIQNLSSGWFTPLSLLFAFVVFVYCLGTQNIEQQIDQIISAFRDGQPAAAHAIIEDLSGDSTVNDENSLQLCLSSTLNLMTERLFGVIFWFAILGPAGALLYRLSQQFLSIYRDDPIFSKSAERMSELLNWLPERFLAISFAITGHFEGALAAFKENKETDRSGQYLLIDICLGALEGNDSNDKAAYLSAYRGLVLRSMIFWLATIAVLFLLGWN
ncbi:MAG: regulatory signaling modulator protein AmpE [Gammaproteobacteria bacterium]|nr:regulatory signaling modulator protein AmpE [Gammaproteobacteria bacterium]